MQQRGSVARAQAVIASTVAGLMALTLAALAQSPKIGDLRHELPFGEVVMIRFYVVVRDIDPKAQALSTVIRTTGSL